MAAPCRDLPDVPTPLIDPERGVWESDIITRYTDCATKHRLTVEAWKKVEKTGNK